MRKRKLFASTTVVAWLAACGAPEATTPPPSTGLAPALPSPVATVSPAPLATAAPAEAAPASPINTAYVPRDLPIGVSRVLYALAVPEGRVPTKEQAALGDRLFDDKRLSSDGTVACNTCHDPKAGFVDHKATSEGVGHQHGERNAPTVLNAMFNASQFWDGRAATLEDQAKLPILNPIEMGMKSPEAVVAKVRAIPEYVTAFQRVYGREVNYDDIAAAIAAFERTQFAGDAPFDRFIQGDEKAIDASARRGWALFNGKARCSACHAGNAIQPLFTDQKFHNIGIAAHKQNFGTLAREAYTVASSGDQKQIDELAIQTKFSELGRFLVTRQTSDIGAFKTPTLRNIAITGPYMHDGSLATLWDVMDHYNKGGVANPFLDGGIQRLGLSETEIDDVVHFMTTLTTDRFAAYAGAEMARQTSLKGKRPERATAIALGKEGDMGDVAPDPNLAAKNPAAVGVFGTYDRPAKGAAHGQ
jgi:cytochrome c peroxidase